MSRRAARQSSLPQSEVYLLKTLTSTKLKKRTAQLFHAGWTLQAIADAFTPPKSRSTIKNWADQYPTSEHSSVDSDILIAPIPQPTYKTDPNGYQRLTPVSPGVPPHTQEELREISKLSKLYRYRMPTTHAYATASKRFTEIILELRTANVSIADIARAAEVTHRAIAKRISDANNANNATTDNTPIQLND
jgi:hypothetical protein